VSAAGQKKGIFGRVLAKAGQSRKQGNRIVPGGAFSKHFVREIFLESMRRVPAGSIDVMSLRMREFVVAISKPGATIPMPPEALITTS